jgi:nitroimidazol reductase NimA-like FMN-containing flavoprotein (pyridoxamine 5'-phosphate oxidase superfamily)
MLETNQHRGHMVRSGRQIPDHETRAFLRERAVAHAGTADSAGWPYVVALMYV